MLLRLLILVIYLKKLNIIKKLMKITNHDHDKYVITEGFNKLKSENFAARLAQANLASKNEILNRITRSLYILKIYFISIKY